MYYLQVIQPGLYPVLGYSDAVIGYEELKIGDVWKVGMTGNGEQGRYPNKYFYKSKDGSFQITKNQLVYKAMYKRTSLNVKVIS